MDWLQVNRGDQPVIFAFPHGGTDLAGLETSFRSPWLARQDTDWWIADLYLFARDLGITTVATTISRSVIDCNRDPSGQSLYPGMATTGLCPEQTFAGDRLYPAAGPDQAEIARRRQAWFDPYHAALQAELSRLQRHHQRIVLFDAHSIRSRVPWLFEGELPVFNLGTNGGQTCAAPLEQAVAAACAASGETWVVNGRFRGGWTTRHYGRPAQGIHALQLELAMSAYLDEPAALTPQSWPAPISPPKAARLTQTLQRIAETCLTFAKEPA